MLNYHFGYFIYYFNQLVYYRFSRIQNRYTFGSGFS